ncbi:GerMN domain-containing protein [Paenibacillus sp. NPDC056722]|uniref:GerMN domain-containing protein n=1 Tax=Paenibacillus sp. NPDC056722 TaxID=3345924 RepID=UPI003677B20C
MNRKQYIRGLSAACLLAVPLTLSGCNWFGSESAAVDPPPSEVEAQMLQISGDSTLDSGVMGRVTEEDTGNVASKDKKASTAKADGPRTTVYLEDEHGLLAPISLALPKGDKSAMLKNSLTALVSQGPLAASLPSGFQGVLPAGTAVKDVTVDAATGLAVVEFNDSFGSYEAKDERKLLEAVTWTLTGQDNIKGVQLWVDGKKLTEMPLKGTPLDRPLSRTMGINLPKHSTNVMNSSAVTVYFSAESPDGTQYYVPVTRFVDPSQEPLKAALNELITGPESDNGLQMVMTEGTKLDSVDAGQNGVVTVSLSDDMFADAKDVPAEMLESVVLTVAQNAEDSLVQIVMNGKTAVTGTDHVDYGKPVSAPEYVNDLPL